MLTTPMSNSPTTTSLILPCLLSSSHFTANSPLLFSHISPNLYEQYLKDILSLLNDPQLPPASKFYTILLLLKSTETLKDLAPAYLSKNKHLLDKLFKDAQFDRQKDLDKRGRKLFSRHPTSEESIIGQNYLRIVLESVVYWFKVFGVENNRHPCYIFTVMHQNLGKLTTLPNNAFYYLNKPCVKDFHLQPFSSLPMSPEPFNNSVKNNISTEKSPEEIFNQVLSCVSSFGDFKKNYKVIQKELEKESWSENKGLLSAIHNILSNPTYYMGSKFYALLLLLKLSETENQVFLIHLSLDQDLLDHILGCHGVAGQEQSSDRKTAILAKNYELLLEETVYFWRNTLQNIALNNPQDSLKTFENQCNAFIEARAGDITQHFVQKDLEEYGNVSMTEEDFGNIGKTQSQSQSKVDEDFMLVTEHIMTCIISEEGYKEAISIISENLQEKSEGYFHAFMENISQVLVSKDTTIQEKYNTLYLLVKLSETGNKRLMECLEGSQGLLERLFLGGEADEGTTQEEEVFYKGYRRLLFEGIMYWNREYGTEKNRFGMMNEVLRQNNEGIKGDMIFIGEDLSMTPLEGLNKFERITGKNQQNNSQEMRVESLKDKLERLIDMKTNLRRALEENREMVEKNGKSVDNIMKDLTSIYQKNVLSEASSLIEDQVALSRVYVRKAMNEGDVFERISNKYLDYKNSVVEYENFRAQVLDILAEQTMNSTLGPETERTERQEDEEEATETRMIIESNLHGEIKGDETTQGELLLDMNDYGEKSMNMKKTWIYLTPEKLGLRSEISSILKYEEGNTSIKKREFDNLQQVDESLLNRPTVEVSVGQEDTGYQAEGENSRTVVIEVQKYEGLCNAGDLEDDEKEVEDLKEEVKRLKEENRELRENQEEERNAMEELSSILHKARGEIEMVYKELEGLKEENTYLRKENEEKEKELKHFKENVDLRGRLDGLSVVVGELMKNIGEHHTVGVKKEEGELLKRMKDLEMKNEGLIKVIGDLSVKNEVMASRMQELEMTQSTIILQGKEDSIMLKSEKCLKGEKKVGSHESPLRSVSGNLVGFDSQRSMKNSGRGGTLSSRREYCNEENNANF